MTDTQTGINLLYLHIAELDFIAHQLEVARRVATEPEGPHVHYYREQIPVLVTRVIEQYELVWEKLQNIADAESGIARIAMRSIMKNCGLERTE